MTNINLGEAFVTVRGEFSEFEREATRGIEDAARRAASRTRPVQFPAPDTSLIEGALSKIQTIARVAAGAAIVLAFKKALSAAEAYAASLRRIAATTGESIEETSRLAFIMERVGINSVLAARLLVLFNRNLTVGTKSVRQYFDGLEIAELRSKTFTQQLLRLSEEFQKLPAGAARTNFLRAFFGARGGIEFGKLLSLTKEEIAGLAEEAEAFGLVLGKDNVEAFKKFTESQRQLSQATLGLQVSFTQLTAPVLADLNTVAAKALAFFNKMPDSMQTAIGVIAVLSLTVGKLTQAFEAFGTIGSTVIDTINLLHKRRVAAAAASAGEVAGTAAETRAHHTAALAVLRHAEAHGVLGAAEAASAAAQLSSAGAAGTEAAAQTAGGAATGGAAAGGGFVSKILRAAKGAASKAGAVIGGVIAGAAGSTLVTGLTSVFTVEIPTLIVGAGVAVTAAAATLGGLVAAGIGVGIGLAAEKFIVRPIIEAAERGSKAADFGALLFPPTLVGKIAAAIGRISAGQRNPIKALFPSLDELDRTKIGLTEIETVLNRAGQAGAFKAASDEITRLKEEGVLTDEVMNKLFSGDSLSRIRKTAEEGGDVAAVIREIADAAANGADTLEELGVTVGDLVGDITELQNASVKAKGQQAQLFLALEKAGPTTEAGRQALAKYAQTLYESARAAAEAAGVEFDAAKARQDAVAAAVAAGEQFTDNQEKIREAQIQGAERIKEAEEDLLKTIQEQREAVFDAQEALAEAIVERAEEIQEAQEAIAEAIADGNERIQEAEESLADTQEEAAERVQEARDRLTQFELDSARRILDAEERLRDARRQRVQAIADARIALEGARRAGNAEAENAASLAASRVLQDKTVKESARALADERKNIIKEEEELRKNLADTIEETAERVQEAEERLRDARVEAAERVREAEERLIETVEDGNKRIQEAAENLVEAQQDAAEAITEAQKAVAAAQKDAADRVNELRGNLEPAVTQMQLLEGSSAEVAENMKKAAEDAERIRVAQGDLSANGGEIPRFQHGGHYPGGLAVVGEAGPELFVADRQGQVFSTDNFHQLLSTMSSLVSQLQRSGGPNRQLPPIVVNEVANDPEATAFAVAGRLLRGVNT